MEQLGTLLLMFFLESNITECVRRQWQTHAGNYEKSLEWCLHQEIKEITLIGFSGLRDDHHTAALFALKSFSEKMDITMLTNHSAVRCIKGSSKFKVFKGQLISILASHSDTLIRTTGLKYELSNEKLLSPGNGISNIAISNHIEIDSNDWVWIFINHLE